jgi:hypothetical protein
MLQHVEGSRNMSMRKNAKHITRIDDCIDKKNKNRALAIKLKRTQK